MSTAGLCELCGSTPVEGACDRCGQLVCLDHFEESSGLCTECLAELGNEPTEGDRGYPDGVEEYRF